MTVINPKSISGITSITTPSGADDLLTIHNNSGAERFRIDGSGNTRITSGIVTTVSVGAVTSVGAISGDISIADKIVHTGDTNTAIRFPSVDTVTVETNGTEAFRVDSSRRLLVNHTASIGGAKLQSNSTGETPFEGNSWNNGANPCNLYLRKSRGATAGTYTIVQSGDGLGNIQFAGADGNGFAQGAKIQGTVDGTPGDGDMPTRLTFHTSADGTENLTERLRINSVGKVGINSTAPDGMLAIEHTSSAPNLTMRNHPAAGPYTNEYGLELRHAYGSVKHGALIHTQEAADGRRSLDVSDSNGIFATFTNGKVGVGTITPTEKFEVHKSTGTTLIKASVNGNSRVGVEIQKTGATTQTWRIQDGQTSNGILEFYDQTNSRSIMHLNTSAGVNINLTSDDASGTPNKYLNLYNDNNSASTMAGLRFAASSAAGTDHWIYQKKHAAGNGTDLIISHGSTERIRFIESGGFTFNGDTSADNALDDYEEGQWTPNITWSTGGNTATYHSNTGGWYTKVGRLVTCHGRIQITAKGGGSSALQIGGLPFTVGNNNSGTSGVEGGLSFSYIGNVNADKGSGIIGGYANEGTTLTTPYYVDTSNNFHYVEDFDLESDASLGFIITYAV